VRRSPPAERLRFSAAAVVETSSDCGGGFVKVVITLRGLAYAPNGIVPGTARAQKNPYFRGYLEDIERDLRDIAAGWERAEVGVVVEE
jgi:hypothetical protein